MALVPRSRVCEYERRSDTTRDSAVPDPTQRPNRPAADVDPSTTDAHLVAGSGEGTEDRAGGDSLVGGTPVFGPPTEPGEVGTLGPYRVVKELGRGGMGAVYLALDPRLNRKLAL